VIDAQYNEICDIPMRGAHHRHHRDGGDDDRDREESRHHCWEPGH
jgi:hypothetical protein